MPNVDMFLLGPVQEGYCTWRDLKDGIVTLSDLADFHELINGRSWAEARMRQLAGQK